MCITLKTSSSVTSGKVFLPFSVAKINYIFFDFLHVGLIKVIMSAFLSMRTSLKMFGISASSNVYSVLVVFLNRGSTFNIYSFISCKFVVPIPELLIIFIRVQIFNIKFFCFSFSLVNQPLLQNSTLTMHGKKNSQFYLINLQNIFYRFQQMLHVIFKSHSPVLVYFILHILSFFL